jgi:hypothetical protein
MKKEGAKVWYVPDGFWPERSSGVCDSHEALCVLNTTKKDAYIEITLYFENREKISGFMAECKKERTNHIRMDKIRNADGDPVPSGIPYAMMVRSSTEIVLQYTRVDSTQTELALMTTIAFPCS